MPYVYQEPTIFMTLGQALPGLEGPVDVHYAYKDGYGTDPMRYHYQVLDDDGVDFVAFDVREVWRHVPAEDLGLDMEDRDAHRTILCMAYFAAQGQTFVEWLDSNALAYAGEG